LVESPQHVATIMNERQFAISGRWALGADNLQWILYRQKSQRQGGWAALSFVRSTWVILARCMHEKDCPPADAQRLLDGLPSTFDEWHARAAQSRF
jgi:hypothetical protein